MKYLAICTYLQKSSSRCQVYLLVAVIAKVEAGPTEDVIAGYKESKEVCAGLLVVVVTGIKADFLVPVDESYPSLGTGQVLCDGFYSMSVKQHLTIQCEVIWTALLLKPP